MTRLEMSLWTLAMLALLIATSAKADHLYTGPPVRETYALSIQLSREAAALTYDVERLLCNCDDYNDVLSELCDVADELEDLNAAIRAATFQPRKWNRICRRAENVVDEVCELDEEIHEAVDDLNRHRPRQTGFVIGGPAYYRSQYRNAPDIAVSFRFGTGRTRVVEHVTPVTPRGIPISAPYRGAAEGFEKPRLGYELEDRVHRMRALAEEIHRLAHAG